MTTECEHKAECAQTVKESAEQAANQAVKKTFAILGVDIDKPESLEEFREDLRFGKRMRKAADKGFMTIVTVLTGALMVALWFGFISKVGGYLKP